MRCPLVVIVTMLAAALAAAVLADSGVSPARAAFPGANGKIAFSSDRDANSEVYVMDADGSGQTNLSNNPAFDEAPAWSPDGTQIVFTSDRDGNQEIHVMDADGSGETNLTNNPAGDTAPDWQPLVAPEPTPTSPGAPTATLSGPAVPTATVGALPETGGTDASGDESASGWLIAALAGAGIAGAAAYGALRIRRR